MKKHHILLYLFFLTTNSIFSQQITVNNTYTDNQLINDFINGTCTTISNVQFQGHTFNDGIKSWGYFNKAQSSFPFEEGIVLTTGKLNAAPGPNSATLSDGSSSWFGDQDLENSVNINNTHNATSLEFDFIPTSTTIRFDYIFASEQYLLNGTAGQCNYTDGFAFILTNVTAGSAPRNLALVPGTTTPVTSSTIRGAGGLCPPANPQYFAGFNNQTSPIAYNGNTIPLTVESTVIPGNTYRIKMVIADQGNSLYDSAVFLRANSFNASIDLGPNKLIADNTALCVNQTLALNANIANATYKWFKNNVQITNQTTGTYTVSEAGTYKVEITQANGCISEGEITIEYDNFIFNNDINLQVCGISGQNNATFILADATNLISTDTFDSITFYQNNNNGVLSGTINSTTPYNANNGTLVYARIVSQSGCEYVATIHLLTNSEDIDPVNKSKCDTDSNTTDGFTSFNLSDVAQTIRTENNLTPNYTVQFFLTSQDALNGINILPNTFINTVTFQQQIFAKIAINGTCFAILKVNLNVINTRNVAVQEIKICKGTEKTLTPVSEGTNYRWSTNESTQSIIVSEAGLYSVTYFSNEGCEITEQFNVSVSNPPANITIVTTDFDGSNNSITVIVNESGIFEYSLDGITYQLSNTFRRLSAGAYSVYVRDVGGCGLVTLEAFILDYPRFVTPNADGHNDTWRIPSLSKIDPKAIVQIFDRYGKLIFQMQPQFSWDGTRKGKILPASDYWFLVTFSSGKELRGHFSLLR